MILCLFIDYADNVFNIISVGKNMCKEDVAGIWNLNVRILYYLIKYNIVV